MNPMLRDELRQMIRDAIPAPVIECTPSGELLSHEAMEVARFYHQATRVQQDALDAMVEALKAP